MKRILTSALVIILLLALSVSCFAAPETLTNDQLTASHVVIANYYCDYSKIENHTVASDEDGDGVYENTTEGGVLVTAPAEEDRDLVVHEIDDRDPDATKWFQENFRGKKNVAPLEIYLVDESGNRSELPEGHEISLANLKEGQVVVGLTTDGKQVILGTAGKDGVVLFKTNGADYYVICTPADEVPEEEEKPSDQPAKPSKPAQKPSVGPDAKPPKTADRTPLGLMIALMLLSIAGVIAIRKKMKKA